MILRERIIKPRVFLSHSNLDKAFIRTLADNLRQCQIDSWVDEAEIRPGTPWLESIFQDGIPTCDSILVYLTDNSIDSQMVKKELDVGIIQKLKDKHVALLPYVSHEVLRSKLRPDIQALHIPVLNNDNFNDILPRLVSEVWRSFSERVIHVAVRDEQNARLKAELEIERLSKGRHQSVFSQSEDVDFKYIFDHFNIPQAAKIKSVKPRARASAPNQPDELGPTFSVSFNLGSLVGNLPTISSVKYENSYVNRGIANAAIKRYSEFQATREQKYRHYLDGEIDMKNDLLTFGLVQMAYFEESTATRASGRWEANFTEKMFRYRYWLAYNKMLSNDLVFLGEVIVEEAETAQPGNGADGG